jgi:hypothetical protein
MQSIAQPFESFEAMRAAQARAASRADRQRHTPPRERTEVARATHHTHTAPDGTTVLLGQQAIAAAQREADACAGGLAAIGGGRRG